MGMVPRDRRRTKKEASHGDATWESLVEGLASLLDSGLSFHEITIAEISESAGLTRSAFYFYFANKAEALAAAIERARQDMMVAAAPFMAGGDPETFYDDVGESLRMVTATWREHRSLLHAKIEASVTDAEVDEEWQEWMLSFREPVLARLGQQAESLGLELDAEYAHDVVTRLLWMNERNFYRHLQHEPPTAKETARFDRAMQTVWCATLRSLLG